VGLCRGAASSGRRRASAAWSCYTAGRESARVGRRHGGGGRVSRRTPTTATEIGVGPLGRPPARHRRRPAERVARPQPAAGRWSARRGRAGRARRACLARGRLPPAPRGGSCCNIQAASSTSRRGRPRCGPEGRAGAVAPARTAAHARPTAALPAGCPRPAAAPGRRWCTRGQQPGDLVQLGGAAHGGAGRPEAPAQRHVRRPCPAAGAEASKICGSLRNRGGAGRVGRPVAGGWWWARARAEWWRSQPGLVRHLLL